MRVPLRYTEYFSAIQVEIPEAGTIATAVGSRGVVGWRWRCRLCRQHLKPNTAGAQAHVAKHLKKAVVA